MSESETMRAAARECLKSGDHQGAFLALRPLLEYPGELDEDGEAQATLEVFAGVAVALGGPELGELVGRAAKSPRDAGALYDVAFMLYEQKQFGIGATLLTRASRLEPSSVKIIHELVSCLEALGANSHAALVLTASGLAKHDPMSAYLLAFNLLMAGDLEAAGRVAPAAGPEAHPNFVFMVGALDAMLARARALEVSVPLDGCALTAWHAALNGSVLLHESPHGYDEPMHGRYAYVADAAGLMREGIYKVGAVLEHVGRRPGRVVAAPDRASQILALATARALDLELLPFSEDGLEDCLVVAWNLDAIGDATVLRALRAHRPGQVLWAHASSWTDPFPYSPDITTLLYQSVTHPWLGGAMRADPDTQQVTAAEPDTRPDDELAAEILAAELTDPSAAAPELLPALLDATFGLAPARALGLRRDEGLRLHQRMGSAVQSNRFS